MPRRPASDWKFFPCQIGSDIAFIYVDVAAERISIARQQPW